MFKNQSILASKKMSKVSQLPKQKRSQQRLEKVIEITENLLINIGVEQISIPEIAKIAEVPRISIYQFFPTKYDLLRHIALLHLNTLIIQLGQTTIKVFATNRSATVNEYGQLLTYHLIQTTAEFYNHSKIASILILGGPFTPESYKEYQNELKKISQSLRQSFQAIHINQYVPQQPDTLTILIELIFTCMKHGYYNDGVISQPICQEAYRIAISYLTALRNQSFIMPNQPH